MPAAVIRFQEDENGEVRFYLERPPGVADGRKLFKLKSQPQDSDFQLTGQPPAVIKAGQRLRDDLLCHSGIKSCLGNWFTQHNRPYQALYFQVDCLAADQLPWEAIVDGNDTFLALDDNSPIARVLSADQQDRLVTEVLFTPPLRIACVLGAWWEGGGGTEQKAEWETLRSALASDYAKELGIEVRVLGCDSTLQAQVQATQLPNVTVNWKPIIGDSLALLEQIHDFKPHILHLQAHGVAGGRPYLLISNLADVDAGNEGSIAIGAKQIRQDGDPHGQVWAVVLNACETSAAGAVARDVSNLAAHLVRYGFPSVLGMRETVAASEARAVTEQFYQAVFDALNDITPGQKKDVEWAKFLRRVRLHLAGSEIQAAMTKRWLLPVLYSRAEPFSVTRAKLGPGLSDADRRRLESERDELIQQRELALRLPVSDDIKAQIRAEFNAKIKQVEAQLG